MRRSTSALLFGLVCATASSARADDGTDLAGLLNETVITTASKSAERGSTAPATSTILTAEDIRIYGIHSIDEAIDFLSLGAVTSNTFRAADIGARGVLLPNDQGDHILLLVNGHAVNEGLYGAARVERGAGVPIELVDHIEVILGPGSVLYGSNAMLGVINVVTKQARDFKGGHVVVESEILKSWRVAAGGGAEPTIGGTPTKLTFELEYYKQSGPSFNVGPQFYGSDWASNQPWRFTRGGAPTGVWGGEASHSYYSEVPSGLLTFKVKNLQIDLHASMYRRASPFNHFFWPTDSDFDDPDNYELDRSAFVDVKQRIELSPAVQLNARVYADTFDYKREIDVSASSQCLFANVATCRHQALGASRWGGIELQTSFDWLKDSRLMTLVGADGRLSHAGAVNDVFDHDTGVRLQSSDGIINVNDRLLGAYLQQTWQPGEWLGINAGTRLDLNERFGSRLSPRVAFNLQTWRGGTLKGVYSEAFRAPSWQESLSEGDTHVVAGNLRPESVRSVEGSLEQRLGSHRLMFGVFRSWWNDLIELHVLSLAELLEAQYSGQAHRARAADQFRNVPSIDNYGFNASYEGSFDEGRLRYGLNVTGAIARRTQPGMVSLPLTVTPQMFGNARISYALSGGLPTIAVAGHLLGRRPADRAFDAGFAQAPFAPMQVELRGTLVGPFPGVRGLSYRGSVNYALASQGPYVIGPSQATYGLTPAGEVENARPELSPVDRFRATIGLQYDFAGSP